MPVSPFFDPSSRLPNGISRLPGDTGNLRNDLPDLAVPAVWPPDTTFRAGDPSVCLCAPWKDLTNPAEDAPAPLEDSPAIPKEPPIPTQDSGNPRPDLWNPLSDA